MKIKLLVAVADSDYVEHLSGILSEKYVDTFEVSVCSSANRLQDLLVVNKYDVALLESDFTFAASSNSIRLPLIVLAESSFVADDSDNLRKIRKYQRISSIAGNILESYAEIGNNMYSFDTGRARVTAVWSPCGGTGKTTVALAYAAHKVSSGKQAVYLGLENFSSTSAYFQETGKSISRGFEKLESNVNMFLKGIRQTDSGSGIAYFCGPENYEDINILTVNDIEILINACAAEADELIVDLSSQCDERVRKIFDMADSVLIINDPSSTAQAKLVQFINQHNIFGQIREKAVIVNNKGAKKIEADVNAAVQLPLVQSSDPISIFKTLSSGKFDW